MALHWESKAQAVKLSEQTGGGGIGPPAILVDTTGVKGGGVCLHFG
jgi:hypothetical protein